LSIIFFIFSLFSLCSFAESSMLNRLSEGDSITFDDNGVPVKLELVAVSSFKHKVIFSLDGENSKVLWEKQSHTFKGGYTILIKDVYTNEAEDEKDFVEYYFYRESKWPDTGYLVNKSGGSNVIGPLNVDENYTPSPTYIVIPNKANPDFDESADKIVSVSGKIPALENVSAKASVPLPDAVNVQEKKWDIKTSDEAIPSQEAVQPIEQKEPVLVVTTKKPSVFKRISNWFGNLF